MTIQATRMPADRRQADGLVGRLAYRSLFCLVLPAAMALWLDRLDRFMPALAMPRMLWGSAATSAGLTIMVWSMLIMIRLGRGQPMNAYPTQAWVTTGPFRVFPHPIYAGFVMTVAGAAIVARSIAGLYVGVPVAAASVTALVLGYEGLVTRRRLGARPFQPWLALPEFRNSPSLSCGTRPGAGLGIRRLAGPVFVAGDVAGTARRDHRGWFGSGGGGRALQAAAAVNRPKRRRMPSVCAVFRFLPRSGDRIRPASSASAGRLWPRGREAMPYPRP